MLSPRHLAYTWAEYADYAECPRLNTCLEIILARTSLCPSSSSAVRVLYPLASKYLTNDCRNVRLVTRFVRSVLSSKAGTHEFYTLTHPQFS